MLSFLANLLPAVVSSALGAASAESTNDDQVKLSREQMAFSERMSNTSYQRAVKDLSLAGLNPMLAYQQGGASTPSTGTYDHTFANIYPVGDAFRYLVEWMSDNQMTCSSPLFDTGGDLS